MAGPNPLSQQPVPLTDAELAMFFGIPPAPTPAPSKKQSTPPSLASRLANQILSTFTSSVVALPKSVFKAGFTLVGAGARASLDLGMQAAQAGISLAQDAAEALLPPIQEKAAILIAPLQEKWKTASAPALERASAAWANPKVRTAAYTTATIGTCYLFPQIPRTAFQVVGVTAGLAAAAVQGVFNLFRSTVQAAQSAPETAQKAFKATTEILKTAADTVQAATGAAGAVSGAAVGVTAASLQATTAVLHAATALFEAAPNALNRTAQMAEGALAFVSPVGSAVVDRASTIATATEWVGKFIIPDSSRAAQITAGVALPVITLLASGLSNWLQTAHWKDTASQFVQKVTASTYAVVGIQLALAGATSPLALGIAGAATAAQMYLQRFWKKIPTAAENLAKLAPALQLRSMQAAATLAEAQLAAQLAQNAAAPALASAQEAALHSQAAESASKAAIFAVEAMTGRRRLATSWMETCREVGGRVNNPGIALLLMNWVTQGGSFPADLNEAAFRPPAPAGLEAPDQG